MESDGSCNLRFLRAQIERTPKAIYTPDFRAEAVKLVKATGMAVARAAKQLSMPKAVWTTGRGWPGKANWQKSARDSDCRASWNLCWREPARNWPK